MKILFVHTGTESLGIEYLSSALKAAGHETALFYEPNLFSSFRVALSAPPKSRAADCAAKYKPGLVCFSVESDYFS